MSGPLRAGEVLADDTGAGVASDSVEVTESSEARVGEFVVRRALPRRQRRTIGAWCFADHLGPTAVAEDTDLVGPHPHTGLQTVTWLLSGELLHRDSLGSEQVVRPGQLNLMTAGRGVAHSEEATGRFRGELQGVQLWVAQPEATRHGDPAFEHHAALPAPELDDARATVLVGRFGQATSPARRDTDHVAVDLQLHGTALVPLDPAFEHGLVVLSGTVRVDGTVVPADRLASLGAGRHECRLESVGGPVRGLLLGGVPFEAPIVMWWNFVARTRDEIAAAYRHWTDGDEWFGRVDSRLARIPVGAPPWIRAERPGD